MKEDKMCNRQKDQPHLDIHRNSWMTEKGEGWRKGNRDSVLY